MCVKERERERERERDRENEEKGEERWRMRIERGAVKIQAKDQNLLREQYKLFQGKE